MQVLGSLNGQKAIAECQQLVATWKRNSNKVRPFACTTSSQTANLARKLWQEVGWLVGSGQYFTPGSDRSPGLMVAYTQALSFCTGLSRKSVR